MALENPTSNIEQVARNRKRIYRISSLKREGLKLAKEAEYYMKASQLKSDEKYLFEKLVIDCNTCCNYSVFREFNDKSIEYCHSFMCDNRLCPVCNSERSKMLRMKYVKYFDKYPLMIDEFDFMHLTLTVPHGKNGFRGEKFYMDHLRKAFNTMRKFKFWKEMVYAGEYSFEFTKNEENGIHCHIHALLLVEKSKQNRNILRDEILLNWNQLTIDNTIKFDQEDLPINIYRLDQVLKFVLPENKESYRELINFKGSTLVGLENLYVFKNGKKEYVKKSDKEGIKQGIMECLKYHFEPFAIKKNKKEYDFDLIAEIMPKLKKKSLYQKFGAFYGEKQLNITENLSNEEKIEASLEISNEIIVHPETLEEAVVSDFKYILVDPKDIITMGKTDKPFIRPYANVYYLDLAHSFEHAMRLSLGIKMRDNQKKNKIRPPVMREKRKENVIEHIKGNLETINW